MPSTQLAISGLGGNWASVALLFHFFVTVMVAGMEALQTAISHWEDALEKLEEQERSLEASTFRLSGNLLFISRAVVEGSSGIKKLYFSEWWPRSVERLTAKPASAAAAQSVQHSGPLRTKAAHTSQCQCGRWFSYQCSHRNGQGLWGEEEIQDSFLARRHVQWPRLFRVRDRCKNLFVDTISFKLLPVVLQIQAGRQRCLVGPNAVLILTRAKPWVFQIGSDTPLVFVRCCTWVQCW